MKTSKFTEQQIVFALQQVDNSTEFISKALDLRAYENNVTLYYSRPGKPTDNPYIESFNGRFKDDVEFEPLMTRKSEMSRLNCERFREEVHNESGVLSKEFLLK